MNERVRRLEVHKFGGTSVGDEGRIRGAAKIIVEAAQDKELIVITSAMSGVTNLLVEAAAVAQKGQRAKALGCVRQAVSRNRASLEALDPNAHEARAVLDAIETELVEMLGASVLLGELTPRTRARVLASGEKMAARLLCTALVQMGIRAVPVDADTFLETDDQFDSASPVHGVAERTTRATLQNLLAQGLLPVVTGYCGRAPDGATTTLGRGGSDFSATFVAGAMDADEVTIWTDVDGVFTSDPRVVPEAHVITQLNFREAAELSYYGAKVLHQRTMIPVAEKRIPVLTRNSFDPTQPGTVIDGCFTPGSHPVKAISAVRGHALLSVEGKGMAGVPGVAARLFGALAGDGISVTMISQSSSESSICCAIPADSCAAADRALKRVFRDALSRSYIEEVVIRPRVALVAAIGLGMARTPGVAARVFKALAAKGINVLAIAQGSSELNISLAVDESECDEAVRAIHKEFGLHRVDTGVDTQRGFDLMLLGCGNIGRALVGLILERHANLFERFGLRAQIVAIADRSGFVGRPSGLKLSELLGVIDAKAAGQAVATLPGGVSTDSPTEMVRQMLHYRLSRPVLVDVSDSDASAEAFLAAFEEGADVVTANKKPLAGPLSVFRALVRESRHSGAVLRAEATVGAGLPVIDTLDMLLATGDTIRSAEGCLSGTLGFVIDRLHRGAKLSEAVREAVKLGYTEPDPVADLCGADVGRKAIILGRLSGLVRSDAPIKLEGLVSPELGGLDLDTLFDRLEELDEAMSRKVADAVAAGQVLRYVARVDADSISVGLQPVPADSPLGTLKGSDNMIVFHSQRYHDRPLVISGPGAGIDVTAMGVLGDILRIAAERS